jgi:hypothetical protein
VAGGISVAYIFIHVLPELAIRQEEVEASDWFGLRQLEHHLYLVALMGLVVFYGIERAVLSARDGESGLEDAVDREAGATSDGVFWAHIASFTVYNLIIGYLVLHREESGSMSLITFGVAMALHFVVNDYGLREHHQHTYQQVGRWVLAAGVLLGWLVGLAIAIGDAAAGVIFAFISGGVILNVLKEELPEERQSRFPAFALGVAAYTAILLVAG